MIILQCLCRCKLAAKTLVRLKKEKERLEELRQQEVLLIRIQCAGETTCKSMSWCPLHAFPNNVCLFGCPYFIWVFGHLILMASMFGSEMQGSKESQRGEFFMLVHLLPQYKQCSDYPGRHAV